MRLRIDGTYQAVTIAGADLGQVQYAHPSRSIVSSVLWRDVLRYVEPEDTETKEQLIELYRETVGKSFIEDMAAVHAQYIATAEKYRRQYLALNAFVREATK